MTTPRPLLLLLLGLVLLLSPSAALNVGRRRISCTALPGGGAVLDPKFALPNLVFFAGGQAILPSFAKCPMDLMYQVPWFEGTGPGFCPPGYWDPASLVPGLAIFAASYALRRYADGNRLVVGTGSLSVATVRDGDVADETTLVDYRDVEGWSVGPTGLSVRRRDGGSVFVPPLWNVKDVEALLEERIG